MLSNEEKPTFGAQVVSSNPQSINLPVINSSQSGYSTVSLTTNDQATTPGEEYEYASNNPCSAFYIHPTTRTSLEQLKPELRSQFQVYEKDLEAGSQTLSSSDMQRPTNECTGTGKRKGDKLSLCMQQKRSWNPMRKLNRKQKFGVQLLIGLTVVSAAVGIGLGISRAVGAGVWKSNNSQTIPH